MKKLLACVLALILMLSCVVYATAALPGADEEIDPQSLTFELPVVTGIEVEWNGEISLGPNLQPLFSPDNVTVTASFEEGEPEALRDWVVSSTNWYWWVFPVFDSRSGTVTFYYEDSNIRRAFLAENPQLDLIELRMLPFLDAYLAALTQASFEYPARYLEQYIEAQKPLAALRLNQAATVPGSDGKFTVFTFTPEKTGQHQFARTEWWNFRVLGPNLESVSSSSITSLEAGKTYYIFAFNGSDKEYEITVTEYSLWRDIISGFSSMGIRDFFGLVQFFPLFVLLMLVLLPLFFW